MDAPKFDCRAVLSAILLALLLTSCSERASQSPRPTSAASEASRPSATPKSLTVAIRGEPSTFSIKIDSSPTIPGGQEVELLVNSGLAIKDANGILQPRIADAVPSVDNGQWQLFPDGTMQTTWRLRPDARWADGTAFTVDDLLFTLRVGEDKDLPVFRDAAFDSIASVETPDPNTIVVEWRQPFIGADELFTQDLAMPMPSHTLEPAYQQEKAAFTQNAAWNDEFVGAGPFKLKQWTHGSFMTLDANDDYVLGRPRLDGIEVRFIDDMGTFYANMLAGTVDLNLGGRNLSLDQALQLRDAWNGRLELKLVARFVAQPQLLNPNPPALANVQFRRAMLSAVDRNQMSDSLLPGASSPVAELFLSPDEPEFSGLAPAIVHYPYDPSRAAQMMQDLGFTKGGDGVYQDRSGQPVIEEIRTVATDVNQHIMAILADQWKHFGVPTTQVVVPPQRQRDLEYRATFPGFDVERQPSKTEVLSNLLSSQARIPETGYLGTNYSRVMDPALDGLIDRYFGTIPWDDRMSVGRQIVQQITAQVIWLDLFYDAQPILINDRVLHVAAVKSASSTETWNAQDWDVR